jgi:hypothetical protein
MLPSPRTSLRLALGAGVVSAVFVLTWIGFSLSLGPGLAVPSPFLIGVALLGMFGAPVLGFLALSWLRTYRIQVEPSRERTVITWAVVAAVAPSFLASAWIGVGIVASLLT